MDFSQHKAFQEHQGKNILAIDYGQKFTGLATFRPGSDPYPLPYGRIKYKSDKDLIKEIKQLIQQEDIEVVVLGIPYFTDGKESKMTKTIKEFSGLFQSELNGQEFFEQDETLTTYEAEDRMKNSPRYNFKVDLTQIDALAASIILEDFIRNS
jgi:putative Holliday junction resolvase